ncbi:MAG: hypothetical protein P4L84_37945 [Isosphaeraceae bacterium]|nr:hypothetical protein [Isosphaeraceae bacterium]
METIAHEPDFNPYAAPTTELGGGTLTEFYRTDSRRFTYGELWRISPNPLAFVIAAVLKTIRVRLPRNFAFACPQELTLVAWDDIAPHVIEKWANRLKECDEAGFHRIFCHSLPCHGITREAVSCVLQTDDRLCMASLNYVRVENMATIKEVSRLTIASRLRDDRRAMTLDYRSYLDPPPDRILQPVVGKSAPEMLRRHRDWIAGIGATAVPLEPKDLPRIVLERERESVQRMVERGVYVRTTERELAQVARRGGGETPPEVINSTLYRFLRGAERVLVVVMLVAIVFDWIAPVRGPALTLQALFRLGLFAGGFACFLLVKIIQFALKRSKRSTI